MTLARRADGSAFDVPLVRRMGIVDQGERLRLRSPAGEDVAGTVTETTRGGFWVQADYGPRLWFGGYRETERGYRLVDVGDGSTNPSGWTWTGKVAEAVYDFGDGGDAG